MCSHRFLKSYIPADQTSIQAGIESAEEGDTVLVEEGNYLENINFLGKAITVASRFILDGDTSHISKTIIDGSNASNPDTASTVIMFSGEDTTSVICGFTITGGSGTVVVGSYIESLIHRAGGGVLIWYNGGKVINNIIEENHLVAGPTQRGNLGCGLAASVNHNHSAVIRDNLIRKNSGTDRGGWGGGASLASGRILFENNTVMNNSLNIASGTCAGGGVFYEKDPVTGTIDDVIIRNNSIIDNIANGRSMDSYSGGIIITLHHASPIDVQIYNNIIANNHGNGYGGGVVTSGFTSHFYNNTIYNNEAEVSGNNIYVLDGSIILINNIIWSDIDNGIQDIFNESKDVNFHAYHNLLSEPLGLHGEVFQGENTFLEPSFNEGSYELSERSPAIGRGITAIEIAETMLEMPVFDLERTTRPGAIDPHPDIGALESGYPRSLLPLADLAYMVYHDERFVPDFDKDILKYELLVPDTWTSPASDLLAFATDFLANVDISFPSNIESENEADRTAGVSITSSDQSTRKDYSVLFQRLSTDASLSELTVSQGILNPVFNPDTILYAVVLPKGSIETPETSCVTTGENAKFEIKNAFDVTHTLGSLRTSRVNVTSEYGEQLTTYLIEFNVSTGGTGGGYENNGFKIFPNPTSDLLTIETEHLDHYLIEITSLNGQQILNGEMDGTTHQIDLSSFQKGIYFITIRSKDLVTTRKIIKL